MPISTPLIPILILIIASSASGALLIMLLIALHNATHFPRLTPVPVTTDMQSCRYPPVSILIPARNEAHNIGRTVQALLAQGYPEFELLLLDDHSTDTTVQMAAATAQGDPRFRLIAGATLPVGWSGKNWACHQLAQQARYDTLLFTDADVAWQPNALPALIAMQQSTQTGLLTVWPTQITQTWAERLVVPLMTFAVWAYLPVNFAHHSPYPLAAAANGQCMLFQRHTYQACGGHAAVRNRVLDDVLLAQRVKAAGHLLRMADSAGLITCRMYHNWQEVLHGYAKNILAGHGASPLLLILSSLFHLTLFVGPWLWLILGAPEGTTGWPLWPLALILAGILVRGMTAYSTRQRIYDSLWMPLSVLLMTDIAWQALWWQWRNGGPQWKGRHLGE